MGRGSTQVLIRKIIEALSKDSMSITELAKKIEFDRTAISKYLSLLVKSGLLSENQEGTSKIYTLVPNYRTDTFFGLPLEEEYEKNVNSLYYLIKKNWKEKTSKPLLKTHAQKIAYEVIELCKLKIPHGWYIYGGICITSFDESKDYTYTPLQKETEQCIEQVTEKFSKNTFTWETKQQQYEKAGKELYLLKEAILKLLYGPNMDKNPKSSLQFISKKLRRLFELAPKNNRENYPGIIDSYQDLMMDITNELNNELLSEKKREIITLFEAVWKYVALFNFKNDLLEYYSDEVLNSYFELDIIQQENDIIEFGSELQELLPVEELNDPIYSQIKEIFSNAKPLSKEDSEKAKKDIEEYKSNNGQKALSEKIRKEFDN